MRFIAEIFVYIYENKTKQLRNQYPNLPAACGSCCILFSNLSLPWLNFSSLFFLLSVFVDQCTKDHLCLLCLLLFHSLWVFHIRSNWWFSIMSMWLQIPLDLQDWSQKFCGLERLNSSLNFQFFQSLYQVWGDYSKCSSNDWS